MLDSQKLLTVPIKKIQMKGTKYFNPYTEMDQNKAKN
jgi:hypothetical protein